MGIKQLYNDNLRKLPNEYGDVSVMVYFCISLDCMSSKDYNKLDSNQNFIHKHQWSIKYKNNVYPWKPQVYYIKVGFGGV